MNQCIKVVVNASFTYGGFLLAAISNRPETGPRLCCMLWTTCENDRGLSRARGMFGKQRRRAMGSYGPSFFVSLFDFADTSLLRMFRRHMNMTGMFRLHTDLARTSNAPGSVYRTPDGDMNLKP